MSIDKQTHKPRKKPRSDFQRLSSRFMSGLLRSLFLINRPVRSMQAGFVLPTTVLLLLVMTLTVGALTFRTASRTQSVYLAREQEVIDNVAVPAVDRAKAKLEYLFTRDTRLPGTGTPPSDVLSTLMLNIDSTGSGGLGITALSNEPYTLPDEQRIDINDDGELDNAWSFTFDLNGDGNVDDGEVIAYSVLMDDAVDPAEIDGDPATAPTPERANDIKLEDTDATDTILKADNLVTRNGPINTDETLANCGGSREPEQGWLQVNSATLEKNFQITAFVTNGKDVGRTNSALELQQVRRALRGNRWGAWFKYDIELHPGPDFNWNGAMHTDGSMMVTNNFKGHMISSHNSCLYSRIASQVTMAEDENFQGQLIAGAPTYGDMNGRGTPRFHIFTSQSAKPEVGGDNTKLTKSNDSVEGDSFDDLMEVALEPVALFTRNVSQHRGSDWERSSTWKDRKLSTERRVINQNIATPYLDDFFRADDRYGPRPSYDQINWVTATEDATNNTTRTSSSYDIKLGDEILASDSNGDNLINEVSGLDGYWERQAMEKGLRVVVGQRLELGNNSGWNFDAAGGTTDPLYPPQNNMANKQRQKLTLRDNLAAVQGMVVYHYESDNGQYPLACYANTAHPGTLQTLINSRDFQKNTFKDSSGIDIILTSNFLEGKGTNGWEYDFPSTFKATSGGVGVSFGAAMSKTQPLGIALRNLAYFAGDPKGGSPSFTPEQEDGFVHPFPQMAMWGDYSVLRRIFDERLDKTNWRSSLSSMSDRYDALSPADKSSLHSAACTLGLLSNNLVKLSQMDLTTNAAAIFGSGGGGNTPQGQVKTEVGNKVLDAFIDSFASEYCAPSSANPGEFDCTTEALGGNPSKEALIAATPALSLDALKFIDVLSDSTQIERDRKYGFQQSPSSPGTSPWRVKKGGAFYNFDFPDDCHPRDADGPVRAFFQPENNIQPTSDNARDIAGVALVCSSQPKYPSLHYLFPNANHGHGDGQPTSEEYITSGGSKYILDDKGTTSTADDTGANKGVEYQVVGDDNRNGTDEASELGMSAISFDSRTTWKLPKTDTGTASGGVINPETMQIIDTDGTLVNVPLLDKVMYNGREEMALRVLDVDLGKLTQNTNGDGSDYWISDDREATSGIFYAAREDARREDSITRPASVVGGTATDWSDCNTLTKLLGSNSSSTTKRCWMQPNEATDPPLSRRPDGSLVGISVKPVDFAPDPDRRPYGFRLNASLDGNNGDLSNRNSRTWGLTFVTDNAAYIRGEFNPHTSDGTDTLEEFEETLYDGSVGFNGPFYDDRSTLNTDEFATDTVDRWRVAEILADSVTPLSDNFVDGAVQEGFIRDRGEASSDFQDSSGSSARTSFNNQQRPLDSSHNAWGSASDWLRADGTYNIEKPVWVGRNGESKLSNGTVTDDATSNALFEMPSERSLDELPDASVPERMNATIISGLVPSRSKQGYGGLHNFPRFLEDWNENDLFIQGAFLQLNFSTAATGPFDADAWQPGENPVDSERINYYRPPARRWGYDVALQYSPAGPIAQRFVTIDRPRSEHYRELSVEDPYVMNLRCSKVRENPDNPTSPFVRQFPDENCP